MNEQGVLAIANRGEIAIRIARTAQRLGWRPVALLGEPDIGSYAAREIGDIELVGEAGAELDVARVVAAAVRCGARALHPGFGFLSERPELSQACLDAGVVFVGPSPETLSVCGDKIATRQAAENAGVPLLPASEPLTIDDDERWRESAERIGFPLMVKVAGGGGGRGLRVARAPDELDSGIQSALREAGASGAGTRLYLERLLDQARHVEVQVAGNGSDAVAIGDRDCSVQRRHQKVIEEAPAFGLSDQTRDELHHHAVAIAREVGLRGLGTVEFLMNHEGALFFIEVNPRLQVEHTVTEEVTGLDLVEVQLALALEGRLPEPAASRGHAIQARLYAEDPFNGFVPNPGLIRRLDPGQLGWLRLDIGYQAGDTIPSHYDSMVGKWIVHGDTREQAVSLLRRALSELEIAGVATNRPWLIAALDDREFQTASHSLEFAGRLRLDHSTPSAHDLNALVDVLSNGDSSDAGSVISPWLSAGPFRIVQPATEVVHGDEAGGWEVGFGYRRDRAARRWEAYVRTTGDPLADREALPRHDVGGTALPVDDGWELATPRGRWIVKPGPRPRSVVGEDAGDGVLRAPMPGSVVAVNVVSGQRVRRGEALAVMTAMKIEMTLAAPFDGVVATVECTPGDLVGTRQVLVTVTRDTGELTNG